MARPVDTIRGERIDDGVWLQRPALVQPSTIRIPLWAMALGWCVKAFGRLVWALCRWWRLTLPVVVGLVVWQRFGWPAVTVPAAVAAGVVGLWALTDTTSCLRWLWWPLVGRWRRWVYRRRWWSAMATAGLVVHFNRHEVLPILKRVTSRSGVDVLRVRMVSGQIPEDFAACAERFVHTFRVVGVRVTPDRRPGWVVLSMHRRDPLTAMVAPLPVANVPDFAGLPLAVREDGGVYELRLFGTHVLVAGATGAGKGSVIWSFLRALAGGIRTGTVTVWGFDPKGGMELGTGTGLFDRLACDFDTMADLLDAAVSLAQQRAARLRGISRQHVPTADDPLVVLVVDELAALTAYLADRKLRDRIRGALSVLLSQGRAVGVHVLAALQDPRKEVLPFRDLFPTRIGLRLAEASQVDLVLGDGARQRGALCDRIPQATPGVGYVVLDGDPTPVRVRFSYLADVDIQAMADTYRPGGGYVLDGDATVVDEQPPQPRPRPRPRPSPRPRRRSGAAADDALHEGRAAA
jgi:S-DNA-T family DNA segregation ATPase FtsK/SpoIIIE